MVPPPTEHEDPRRVKSRERVLAAAVAVLRESGHDGLTVESVAARSGVAKTTIYRQFADSEELHLAAVHSVGCEIAMAHSPELIADVTAFCQALNQMLRTSDFGALLPTALDGAERSESFAGLMHDIGVQRRRVLADRLKQAQADGVLSAAADLDLVTSQLVGPLFYRRFISRQATGPAFVARHVAAVLMPLLGATCASPGSGARSRSAR